MNKNSKNDEFIDPLLSGLTAKQQAALPLLIGGSTTKEAAKQVGIHPGTISNWRGNNSDFRSAEIRLRSMATQEANRALQALCGEAVSELARLLGGAGNDRVRFDVAKFVIEKSEVRIPSNDDGITDGSVDIDKVFEGLGVSGLDK